jgi:hypothetical protein
LVYFAQFSLHVIMGKRGNPGMDILSNTWGVTPMVDKPVPAIILHCDNQSMITIVGNAKENAKFSRHVKQRIKSVRHLRNTREIVVEYINTAQNLADPFTKGLACVVIDEASRELGLKPT